jgi:serine protease Do
VLADVAKNVDAQNAPLTEEQESRLAWLGVELQPLDRELARACGVSDLCNDGLAGAVVSYVYEDSPAAKQGIKQGDIVLRLHVQGQPKPIDVQIEPSAWRGSFPWDRLDKVPEQYYDQIPPPWGSAETRFIRALTDVGFGKAFQAEFFRDGNTFSKEFTVVEGPGHYASAPKFKSEPLGLTVRDMTYEVRRYFQKKPGEPGVIVAMLVPGSKASVAGLKPFEIITQVNDQPVNNSKDFERLIKDQSELRLSVSRMTQGRVVKIRMGGAASQDAAASRPAKADKAGAPAAEGGQSMEGTIELKPS